MSFNKRDNKGRFVKSSLLKATYIKRDELIAMVKQYKQELYEKEQKIQSLEREKEKYASIIFILGALVTAFMIGLMTIRFW